jgi:hypothetical protein
MVTDRDIVDMLASNHPDIFANIVDNLINK